MIGTQTRPKRRACALSRDFRIWDLPENTRALPTECVKLKPGQTLEVDVEGGMETADLVVKIANDNLGYKKSKVIMVFKNIDPTSNTTVFKCVRVRKQKKE